jgi:type I restriction enzyme R subunit
MHRMLVEGVDVEYRDADGTIRGAKAALIDFKNPANNHPLAVNQFTIIEDSHNRRPDVILFVNGLPLVVIELKAPGLGDEWEQHAHNQIGTYKQEIPSLFTANAAVILSDGVVAKIGSLTAGMEWFKTWRTPGGSVNGLKELIEGVLTPAALLELLRTFTVFEDDGGGAPVKKLAGYHQYYAVQEALASTVAATGAGETGTDLAPLPVIPLEFAAGAFGEGQTLMADDVEWATVDLGRSVEPGMFLARVTGKSMEPRIPDGSLCLFRAPVTGTREGRDVVAELRDSVDPETGSRYTVKRYSSEKVPDEDGGWRHSRVTLAPANPDFEPIVIENVEEGDLAVVAEFLEVVEAPGGAAAPDSEQRRIGVVWHTQGSGKSLTMAFYAGAVIREPAMRNPTIVVITDRNDLDQQLFGTFARCRDLLRQDPVQAGTRAELRELLTRESGGVVFTTIQKFFPEEKGDTYPALSDRSSIVVIADEAHRSQYDFIDGFARHMRDALPNASFIGFTGTPIESTDANTRAVFGEYISVYDIERAVEDGATVPIYYESRLAELNLDESERPTIDPDFEEATESEEESGREKLKSKWAALEAIVGSGKRLDLVARDIVEHFENRTGEGGVAGKGMIVVMSRRIAVELYDRIVALRPEWTDGFVNVVMTGSAADGPAWQQHIRTKQQREELAVRFRDPADPFRLVIVRDMWLTGFDAPSLHTMYVDKPMRGHGLMQAIARVNRVFRDKQGGLVVDYIGLAAELKKALATYTESGGKGRPTLDQASAIAVLQEKYEVVAAMFAGEARPDAVVPAYDYRARLAGGQGDKLIAVTEGLEHVLALRDGKARFTAAVSDLKKAFSLAIPSEFALSVRDEVGYFELLSSKLTQRTLDPDVRPFDADAAIRQIVSRAVVPGGVVDIFAAAGLERPEISVLDERFLDEIRGMPQRNLAVEMLEKLLHGEIRRHGARSVVSGRRFSEMLELSLIRYRNRSIEAAAVIAELIGIAREVREADARGEELGLNEDEYAFYEALDDHAGVREVMGDAQLAVIARELVDSVRGSVTIDWTMREDVRARMRVMVRRILRKYGYPPDKADEAVRTVIAQAEASSRLWA